FLDATGRMGPSTWEMGAYPEGLGEYPVSGISWYEAEAYAEFAHKSLPSIFHWNIAANPLLSSAIVPLSNYSGHGPAPVGSFKGMSMFGTYDMAGNAREWCWNEGMNQRFILGGGWNDPNYTFQDDFTQAPFNRYETNGFRCVMYIAKDEDRSSLLRSIDYPYRDFMTEQPISEEIREVYKKMFEYDRTDLEAEVVSVEQSESGYIKEEITFNAAYNNERATAFLLLPEKGNPPYQVVVYFPGSNALQTRSNENMEFRYIDFMLKSGRAVMFPVYKSTYERGDGLAST
ncbi:SUMF1/EgtB/PvdO family nonheme iron enzyme, partial [bacterium]|nr:SUMF1/EgtB/PvdO family nonheme iron enzyme [bacterium]